VASSTLGRWPLLGGRRFARAAIPRPGSGRDSQQVALAVGDYLFGLDEQPAPAELGTSRIPDAATGFRWTLSYRTDVLVAYDGTEQRRATLTHPRQKFDGSFLLDDADTRTIRQLLSASADGTYELPLPHEAVAAIVELTGGTIYISADAASKSDWIENGRRIYVRGPSGSAYTTTITGSSGGTINVVSSPPVGGYFPAHTTLIFPVETVRFEDGQTIGRYPVNASRWRFTARAGARALGGAGAPALTTFDGYTVLDRRPFQEKETPEVFGAGVEFLDNGATMTSDTAWGRAKHRRMGTWRIDSPSDRQWWKAFLTERRGRWQPFLFPTWRPDLVLHEQPAAGASAIRVTTDYINNWYPSLAHRRLQIEYADRSVSHHYVHSTSQGSGYQEITLVPTLANPIPTGGVTRVSFLETARLDTDEVAIEYGGGWKAKVSPPAIVVQESNVRSFAWPSTAAALRAAFGFGTWASAWLCDEELGNLSDSIGGVPLSRVGSPLYRQTGALASDYAVTAGTSSDDFLALSSSSYLITTTGQVAFYACVKFPAAQADYIIGKHGGSGGYYAVRLDASGFLHLETWDGSTLRTSSVSVNHANGSFVDVLAIVDRDGGAQRLVTSLGVSSETSIASALSMSGTGVFRFGLVVAANAPIYAFAAVADAGVGELRAAAAVPIANIRRFTGRA
jgi:hypothetical protein